MSMTPNELKLQKHIIKNTEGCLMGIPPENVKAGCCRYMHHPIMPQIFCGRMLAFCNEIREERKQEYENLLRGKNKQTLT